MRIGQNPAFASFHAPKAATSTPTPTAKVEPKAALPKDTSISLSSPTSGPPAGYAMPKDPAHPLRAIIGSNLGLYRMPGQK